MRARTLQRPCPHGREQPPSGNTFGVRGLGPRTFSAKRRTQDPSESEAFARRDYQPAGGMM
jgi:hypothetical protein